jgi:hypothetical protein
MSRADPGTGRSCATGGPRSAPLIPHFGLPPPLAVERMWDLLKDFCPFWKDVLGCTPYTLEAETGLRPHFTSPPPLALPGPHFSTLRARTIISSTGGGGPPFQGSHRRGVSTSSMLHQPHFSCPKEKWGHACPILNLKKFNVAHMDTPYFRMETMEYVRHALRPGDWAASIDLRDAYFHVPLHHSTRKYMFFEWKGCLFRFCVLPFGLSPAPKVFTCLTRFIKVHFRSGRRGGGGGGGGLQPSFPSAVLERTARGILNYSLVAFLLCFGLSAAEGRN